MIEENRKKRKNNTKPKELNIVSDELTQTPSESNIYIVDEDIDILNIITKSVANDEEINSQIKEIKNSIDSNISEIPVISEVSSVAEEMAVITVMRPISDYNSTFTETEGNRLTELMNGTQYFRPFKGYFTINNEVTNFREAVQLMADKCEFEIKTIVLLSKSLNKFRTICENDQIALIKSAATEIVCLRSVQFYDQNTHYWNISLVLHLNPYKALISCCL